MSASLLAHPRSNPSNQTLRPALPTILFRRVLAVCPSLRATEHPPEIQLSHPRPAHQIRHAVDNNHRMMSRPVSLKRVEQSHSVLAVHHMNYEDDIRPAQIPFNLAPLPFRQARAEIVRSYSQVERILTINLALSLPQRGEKT
jgi:hypothetical protein